MYKKKRTKAQGIFQKQGICDVLLSPFFSSPSFLTSFLDRGLGCRCVAKWAPQHTRLLKFQLDVIDWVVTYRYKGSFCIGASATSSIFRYSINKAFVEECSL